MRTAQLMDADFAGRSRGIAEAATDEARASATVSLLPVGAQLEARTEPAAAAPVQQPQRLRRWLQGRLASWLLAAVSMDSRSSTGVTVIAGFNAPSLRAPFGHTMLHTVRAEALPPQEGAPPRIHRASTPRKIMRPVTQLPFLWDSELR